MSWNSSTKTWVRIKAALELFPERGVVLEEVARLDEQVEEVQPSPALHREEVVLDHGLELALEVRRAVGAGPLPEVRERFLERVALREELHPGDAFAVGSASLAPAELEPRELVLEHVVVALPADLLLGTELLHETPHVVEVLVEIVAVAVALVGLLGEEEHALHEIVDLSLPLERLDPPRGGEVPDVDEPEACVAKLVDGPELAEHALAQQAAHARRRVRQRALEPPIEDAVVEPARLLLGCDLEARVDARLQRPLLQQVRAEAVDRADVRFLELEEPPVEPRAHARVGELGTRPLELAPETELQLARRLLRERHRDEVAQLAPAALDDLDDPPDERGRLSRAGRGLDDEGLVELAPDRLTRVVVGQGGRTHVKLLSQFTGDSVGSSFLRFASVSIRGPHTAT